MRGAFVRIATRDGSDPALTTEGRLSVASVALTVTVSRPTPADVAPSAAGRCAVALKAAAPAAAVALALPVAVTVPRPAADSVPACRRDGVTASVPVPGPGGDCPG